MFSLSKMLFELFFKFGLYFLGLRAFVDYSLAIVAVVLIDLRQKFSHLVSESIILDTNQKQNTNILYFQFI